MPCTEAITPGLKNTSCSGSESTSTKFSSSTPMSGPTIEWPLRYAAVANTFESPGFTVLR